MKPERSEKKNLPGPAIGAITAMIDRRNKAILLIEKAMDLINEARSVAPSYAFEPALRNQVCWYSGQKDHNKEMLRRGLDHQCWNALLKETKLGTVMNSRQLERIRKDIDKYAPELTLDSAMNTFMDLYTTQEATFRDGLVDVFRSLSGNYKSHDVFKIKKRVIFNDALSARGWKSHRSKDRFNDLWHYLLMLDGKNPSLVEIKDQPASIIQEGRSCGERKFEFEQFRVTVFQHGNLHLWLRSDLIDKVNAMIAEYYGETLPGSKK